jgi:uncharacterized membrane protein SpoIIM required for sporulation
VDIDAFVAAHQHDWARLEALTHQARRISRMRPEDLDALTTLYQRSGAHLAHARVAYASDHAVVSRLTLLVSDAHRVLYGQRQTETTRNMGRFATVTFPAAMASLKWFIVASALLTLVPWAVMMTWIAVSPQAFDLVAPDAVKEAYVNNDFESYYSSQPAQNFASQVFFNNIRVAFLAFAAGILLCVVTAALLAYNGAMVGVAGGLFLQADQGGKFWGLILPHGLLELSAVIVAGAAGLRIGWTVIDPGDRPRISALTAEARRAGNVLIGLVVAFLLAALVEGFVTGRPWPTWLRVGIGVVVFAVFWGWTIVFARRIDPDLGGEGAIDDGAAANQSRPEALSSR